MIYNYNFLLNFKQSMLRIILNDDINASFENIVPNHVITLDIYMSFV